MQIISTSPNYGHKTHKHIYLTDKERKELEQMIKSGIQPLRVIARTRTLLLLDRSQGETQTIAQVMEAAMVSQGTVSNLKKRYFNGGLYRALNELPRPGAKPKIDGEVEAHLVALACSDPPEGYDHWTLRLLADRLVTLEVIDSFSHVAVGDAVLALNLSMSFH